MSSYRLVFKPKAKKDIEKTSTAIQKRIIKKLKFFMAQPDPVKAAVQLTGSLEGHYRWRIGVYRVVFDIESKDIVVLRVQHRRDVYRNK